MKREIKNLEQVLVEITNASNVEFMFPINSQLEGKAIVAIETYKTSEVTNAPDGSATLNDTAMAKAFVTLSNGSKEFIQSLPLRSLIASNNNGNVREIAPQRISLQKSKVKFSNTTGLVAGEKILFVFYYE